jgi:DNA repair protein RecN (Recombination protein N)
MISNEEIMNAPFHLKNLIIQNFATFKNQSIKFRPGFNAIVGETGSGKSLVLDALQLILGGRADKKVVRRETDYSLIEASFHCEDQTIKNFLENEGYPLDNHELVIKRLIYKNGTTKNYVNHLSCTVNFLGQFSRRYIDLVGQFENQKLLSESYQLHLLDHFSHNHELVKSYQAQHVEYKALLKQKEELENSKAHREQRLDYLTYQLQEIEKLNPSSQDEEDLLKTKNQMMNIEKTQKVCFQAQELFEGGESQSGILSLTKSLSSLFAKNPDLFQGQLESLSNIDDLLQTLAQEVEKKLHFEFDPADLEVVLDRLDLYQKLKKKFGGSVETILQSQVEFMREKTQLEELEIGLEGINEKIRKASNKLETDAQKLHQKRVSNADKLSKELTTRMRALKMEGSTLKIEVQKVDEFLDTGVSKVFFVAETNKGEGFFKIKDIASGGELSRILLSVRQILSMYDSISIFLFDEIDTGIGGETANCIGKALAEVSDNGQVIAITHLPQIAQFAEAMIVVQKSVQTSDKETRTESSVQELVGKNLLKEVKLMAQLN